MFWLVQNPGGTQQLRWQAPSRGDGKLQLCFYWSQCLLYVLCRVCRMTLWTLLRSRTCWMWLATSRYVWGKQEPQTGYMPPGPAPQHHTLVAAMAIYVYNLQGLPCMACGLIDIVTKFHQGQDL